MTTAAPPLPDWRTLLRRHWPLWAGVVVLVVPTLVALGQGPWQEESGVHGIIVLFTGMWLLWQRLPEMMAQARPGNPMITAAALAVALPLYMAGRAFEFISIETAAMLLALAAVAHQYLGLAMMRRLWFPIVYLGFVIPLPGWFLDQITLPLKILVSEIVTHSLAFIGYPVGRMGVTLYIGSYQLLVEDACSGLNSLVSLSAIGLFYVYLIRGSTALYSLLLLALVLPVAVAANCVRVAALVLITHHFGNAMAQGYLHNFAGLVTFVSALLFIFLLDWLLTPLRRRLSPHEVAA